jgi:hypothetical protein
LGQINHCTVHVKKTEDLEKGGVFSFQDLAEKLRCGITEVCGEILGKKKGE